MKSFELGPEEKIIAIFRKHPLFIWLAGIRMVFLAIIPLIMWPFITTVSFIDFGNWATLFFWGYLIILWLGFFIEWTDFILDTWILTNERLIDVEQLGLFSRRVSTLSLDRIQDVTIQESGLINTYFGIGTVYIQTAGEHREFKIPGAKHPTEVKDIIMQTYQASKDRVFKKIADLA